MTAECLAIVHLIDEIDKLDTGYVEERAPVQYCAPRPEPVAAAVWALSIAIALTALWSFWFYSHAI